MNPHRTQAQPRIDTWLTNRSFHYRNFHSHTRLLQAKATSGLRISLCLPTWNEASTIGPIVRSLKTALVDKVPLLDEIAVIDSGSTDQTCTHAAESGADVYFSGNILPNSGFHRGKGENLWKATHQLRGDVIVFIDSDIRNISPRFVTGLLGPILQDPTILYVKGYYHRPADGGRVTEILSRPLFSLFYPELTAFTQPLSGEYAVRRSLLETLAFPVGYAVETAHLLDVHATHGLDAFAQTDLGTRHHHPQSTQKLGEMAFEILTAFFRRTRNQPINQTHATLHQFVPNTLPPVQHVTHINTTERPPLITLPDYLLRHASITK